MLKKVFNIDMGVTFFKYIVVVLLTYYIPQKLTICHSFLVSKGQFLLYVCVFLCVSKVVGYLFSKIRLLTHSHFYQEKSNLIMIVTNLSSSLSKFYEIKDIGAFCTNQLRLKLGVSKLYIYLKNDYLVSKDAEPVLKLDENSLFAKFNEYLLTGNQNFTKIDSVQDVEIFSMGYRYKISVSIGNQAKGYVLLGERYCGQDFIEDELNILTSIVFQLFHAIERIKPIESDKEQYEIQKKRIKSEYGSAKAIQESLLPQSPPILKGLNIDMLLTPSLDVGGDYFDFFKFSDDKLGVLITDIVGKGIPAGFCMLHLQGLIKQNISGEDTPQAFMTQLNKIICLSRSLTKFVPLFYGIFDLTNQTFTYVNAMGNAGVIYASKTEAVRFLDTGGFLLGAGHDETYEQETVHYQSMDKFLFFTDGLTEQKNEEGHSLNLEGVIDIMGHDLPEGTSLKEYIFEKYETFKNNCPQDDDLSIIAIEIE